MTVRRAAFGAVFVAAGAAMVVWGVIIASGDSYDIGRGGLVVLGGGAIAPGCALMAVGALLLRQGSAVAGRVWLACAIVAAAIVLFVANWVVSFLLIILALAIVAYGWIRPHWSEEPARERGRAV